MKLPVGVLLFQDYFILAKYLSFRLRLRLLHRREVGRTHKLLVSNNTSGFEGGCGEDTSMGLLEAKIRMDSFRLFLSCCRSGSWFGVGECAS